MEIVEVILSFISKPSVTGFTVLGIALVQIRKVLVKRIDTKSIQNTNETKLKIEREKNKTTLKLAQLNSDKKGSPNSMTRVS